MDRRTLTIAGVALLGTGGLLLLNNQKPGSSSAPASKPAASTTPARPPSKIQARGSVPVWRSDAVFLGNSNPNQQFAVVGPPGVIVNVGQVYPVGWFSGTNWAGYGYIAIGDAAVLSS